MIWAYGHSSNPLVLIAGTLVVGGVWIIIRTALRQADGRYSYNRGAISGRLPNPPASPPPPPPYRPTRPATDAEIFKMLACSARAIHSTASNHILRDRVYRKITNPSPGDFVLLLDNLTSFLRSGGDLRQRFGRVIDLTGTLGSPSYKVRTMAGETVEWFGNVIPVPDRLDTSEWAREADLR